MPTFLSLWFMLSLNTPMGLPSSNADDHAQREAMEAVSQELRLAKVSGDVERVKETAMQLYVQQIQIGCPDAALKSLRINHRWIENHGHDIPCKLSSVTVQANGCSGQWELESDRDQNRHHLNCSK